MTNALELVALLLGLVAIGGVVVLFLSLANIRRRLLVVRGRGAETDVIEAISRHVDEVRALRGDIKGIEDHMRGLSLTFQGALQRFAIFRYDAFEDMGGKLSFSAALLNDNADGIIITCINGRQEARTYSKPVQRGASVYNLSPEEEEAIRQAMGGKNGS